MVLHGITWYNLRKGDAEQIMTFVGTLLFTFVFQTIFFFYLLSIFIFQCQPSIMESRPFPKEKNSRVFSRIAHRGGAAYFPENTMLAFRMALEKPYKADILELDIRLNNNGVIVVGHDENLKRTTGMDKNLSSLSEREISRLDAAYNFQFPLEAKARLQSKTKRKYSRAKYPYRGYGIRIPTLRRVFQMFPDVIFNIEIKSTKSFLRINKELWKLIQEFKRQDKTIIVSVSHDAIKNFRKLSRGQVATAASLKETIHFYFSCYLLSQSCNIRFTNLQLPQMKFLGNIGLDVGSQDFIRFSHQQGLLVYYWTVNETDDIKKLIRNGADGIITDYLDKLYY